jgi:glycosyltransferase involved in cell wall biosynthesis
MKIFVVIPVFNEESRVGDVINSLKKTKLPLIFIDDGSTDKSWKVLNKHKDSKKITRLHHKINLGKGAAMKTGAEAAFKLGAEAVIFMDSDGQHSVDDLPKFTKKLTKHDVVFGEREITKDTSLRIYGSRAVSILVKLLFGINISDLLSGYRAITKKAYKLIKWDSAGYGVETEMVVRVGRRKLKYTTVKIKSIYHDTFKGFTIMDAFRILYNIITWRLTL